MKQTVIDARLFDFTQLKNIQALTLLRILHRGTETSKFSGPATPLFLATLQLLVHWYLKLI